MHWYNPDLADVAKTASRTAAEDPIVYTSARRRAAQLLYGSLDDRKSAERHDVPVSSGGTATAPQLQRRPTSPTGRW